LEVRVILHWANWFTGTDAGNCPLVTVKNDAPDKPGDDAALFISIRTVPPFVVKEDWNMSQPAGICPVSMTDETIFDTTVHECSMEETNGLVSPLRDIVALILIYCSMAALPIAPNAE
jgi:hypothetical protein